MDNLIIRKARKEEAAQIAELFLLAWPVDEIASSSGITPEELYESVTHFSASPETIYSYENTYVPCYDYLFHCASITIPRYFYRACT